MTKDMTQGSPLKLIVQFSLPLLAGNIFQQTYNMVDAAIVGRVLGPQALGAVGSSSSVQFLILGFCFGLTTGFTIPIAQRFGAKAWHDMRQYVYLSILSTLAMAFVFASACALLCPQILHALSTPQDIFADAYSYLVIIFLGIPFTLLYNLLAGILRAVGDSKTPFIFLVISSILNIGLDLLFIVVFKMGVRGASLATIIAQAISCLLCIILILKKFLILRLRKKDCTMSKEKLARLFQMGIPMGLQFSITAIGSIVIQTANNRLGSIYVSAFTAASKIKQLGIYPFDAIASAVSTYASQNYGAKNLKRIKSGLRTGLLLSFGFAVLFLCPFMIILARPLSMIFISASEANVLAQSAYYVRLMGYFFWLISLLQTLRLTIQGLGFSHLAIFSGVFEMIARCAIGFGLVPKLKFTAICIADPAAWLVAVLWCSPILIYCIRKIEKRFTKGEYS